MKNIIFCIVFVTSTITPFEKNIPYYIIGAATALIVGKLSYDYYQTDHITSENIIKNCRALCATINHDVQQFRTFYYNNARMSDWDLKEMIVHNHKEPYPFLMYYTDLHNALLLLKKHTISLTKQLSDITKYKKKLHPKIFLQLQAQAQDLQHYISKIMTFMTSLHMRIKLFREYQEDCYYAKQKTGIS